MIAIIDYGMGNLRSVQKGCEKMGYAAEITREAARIETADGVILPGVGAFGACMNGLAECGLLDTVHRVVEKETPLLGICVGMQILFSDSVEFGRVKGLDILKGTIERFDPATLAALSKSTDDDTPQKIRDIEQLRPFEPDGIQAVIIGRAIYTGGVDLAEAIRVGKGLAEL